MLKSFTESINTNMRFIKFDHSVQNRGENECLLNPQIVLELVTFFNKKKLKNFFNPNPNNLVNGHRIITFYPIYNIY